MPNLLLSGASGQLCSAISRRIHAPFSILCGVDPVPPEGCAYPVYPSFSLVPTAPEVIVDASHHTAIRPLLEYATAHHTPVVLCTTGHTAAELSFIQQAAREIPVLQSQNMALGLHLIAALLWKPITGAKPMLPAAVRIFLPQPPPPHFRRAKRSYVTGTTDRCRAQQTKSAYPPFAVGPWSANTRCFSRGRMRSSRSPTVRTVGIYSPPEHCAPPPFLSGNQTASTPWTTFVI